MPDTLKYSWRASTLLDHYRRKKNLEQQLGIETCKRSLDTSVVETCMFRCSG